jgi:hypothetical protein
MAAFRPHGPCPITRSTPSRRGLARCARPGHGEQMRRTLTTHGQATLSRVEALAEAQLGVLTRAQCLGLGMTASALKWMVHAGRWQRVHLGVYATHVGPLDWRARVSAAVLYCGDGAVASHSTAARLHGLAEQDPDVIEVLIPASRRVVRPGLVRLATCADLSRRTARSGWPTRTTVEDTVLDMAEQGDADNAIAWVSKACQRRRTTPAATGRCFGPSCESPLAQAAGRRTHRRGGRGRERAGVSLRQERRETARAARGSTPTGSHPGRPPPSHRQRLRAVWCRRRAGRSTGARGRRSLS